MDISVLWFYGYIEYNLSTDILEKNIGREYNICIIWFIIFDNNILCINKKNMNFINVHLLLNYIKYYSIILLWYLIIICLILKYI